MAIHFVSTHFIACILKPVFERQKFIMISSTFVVKADIYAFFIIWYGWTNKKQTPWFINFKFKFALEWDFKGVYID